MEESHGFVALGKEVPSGWIAVDGPKGVVDTLDLLPLGRMQVQAVEEEAGPCQSREAVLCDTVSLYRANDTWERHRNLAFGHSGYDVRSGVCRPNDYQYAGAIHVALTNKDHSGDVFICWRYLLSDQRKDALHVTRFEVSSL